METRPPQATNAIPASASQRDDIAVLYKLLPTFANHHKAHATKAEAE